MKPEIPAKGAHEVDAFTIWRKWLCYMQRSGVVKKVQRSYNKRVRQHTKMEIAKEIDENVQFDSLDDMEDIVEKIKEASNGEG